MTSQEDRQLNKVQLINARREEKSIFNEYIITLLTLISQLQTI